MFWILFFRKFDKMCISVSVLRYALTGHTVVVVGGQVNFFHCLRLVSILLRLSFFVVYKSVLIFFIEQKYQEM